MHTHVEIRISVHNISLAVAVVAALVARQITLHCDVTDGNSRILVGIDAERELVMICQGLSLDCVPRAVTPRY